MAEDIAIHAKSLPSGFCPTTEQARLNAYASALVGVTTTAVELFVVDSATPAISSKVWIRLNSDGSIDRPYKVVDGAWKSRHPLQPGSIMLWRGAQADIANIDGGIAGTATIDTGPFWKEITEAIGRTAVHPDPSRTLLQNQTVTGGGSAVIVGSTGGEERHTLAATEIPNHVHSLFTANINTGSGTAAGVIATSGNSFATGNPTTSPIGQAHQNMQPFIGMYYVERTTRIFYRQ